MKSLQIKNILIPTDFSKTGLLALEHAAFMARLHRANLHLFHAIELLETPFSIYNSGAMLRTAEVEQGAVNALNDLAIKLKKEFGITVKTICSWGKAAFEISQVVKDNDIDIVIMGTHGTKGFNEVFIGSNAYKTVTVCPCPVITVQTHARKLGFTNIVLPIDNSMHSREKVNHALSLAKSYAAKIHIIGLVDKDGETDIKKFKIKLESVEKAIEKAGLVYDMKIIKGDNLAVSAIKYSKKVKADLIVVLTGHESKLNGIFLDAFSKQIVNHSRIPVMSIKPEERKYELISLAASNPF
jgi:nucleotide-binding universal stress UspA family protein